MAPLATTRALGPGLWSMGLLGPFWPNSNEAKMGQGGSSLTPKARWVPNHKWAHLSQLWPQTPINLKWPKTTLGPKLSINNSIASGNHQRPPAQLKTRIPSSSGEDFPFFNALCTKGPGVVHIWYNIPLCTIFSQQSNGDTFRTQLCDSK
ncbi:hypothetical protein O181_035439 [Austropuccinia psidii MF-1]|uniref:Uncharacterized protein n=1 Tax=Austropuccinia psidii MF-1 TaxID=1389203 RepID=A0A9Q3D2M9_9BASI|nr:hypothetical protein [Austropuccinia psidii MF-1]